VDKGSEEKEVVVTVIQSLLLLDKGGYFIRLKEWKLAANNKRTKEPFSTDILNDNQDYGKSTYRNI